MTPDQLRARATDPRVAVLPLTSETVLSMLDRIDALDAMYWDVKMSAEHYRRQARANAEERDAALADNRLLHLRMIRHEQGGVA